ncbi:cache domain-containing protein [Candidatus Babeliales bacterium]|nr:cache domain-containing protein [Candidatus Babeliales bacterium]
MKRILLWYVVASVWIMVCGQSKEHIHTIGEQVINAHTKYERAEALVHDGVAFLNEHSLEDSCYAFLNDLEFIDGDMQLFIMNEGGVLLCAPPFNAQVWQNLQSYKNEHGIVVGEYFSRYATDEGNWLQLRWHGAYQSFYVQRIMKNKKQYVIGSGWAPMTGEVASKDLVKRIVAHAEQYGKHETFQEISNKHGKFVIGDLYAFVYDFDGYCLANGDDSELIGQRLIGDERKDRGMILQRVIDLAKTEGAGWVEYMWENAPKRAFIKRVHDIEGDYLVGVGYYPGDTRDVVLRLVSQAVDFFQKHGLEKAAAHFNYDRDPDVEYGESLIFMYRTDGLVLAHGEDPNLVGQNLLLFQTPLEQESAKRVIEIAQKGGGWVKYRWKRNTFVAYVRKVRDGKGEYVIGSGFYPYSERQTSEDLVKDAIIHIHNTKLTSALRDFLVQGDYNKGSYSVSVFNAQGDCLVYGRNADMIWRNFKLFKDTRGVNVFSLMKKAAKKGGGWITYESKNVQKHVYVEPVKKDGKWFLVSSGFYE